MKPHPQLPGHAQDLQRRGVIAVQIVIGKIALAAQAMEQLGHLPLQHAIALQPPQQQLLGFLHPQLHPEARRHLLSQQLPQLPELEQRCVRILWETTLRQRTQPKQLLVVLAEVGEVGADHTSTSGRILSAIHRLASRAVSLCCPSIGWGMTESRWVATLERLADTNAARHSWQVPFRASGSGDAGKSLAERRGMRHRPGEESTKDVSHPALIHLSQSALVGSAAYANSA